jgi:hypothetical protein
VALASVVGGEAPVVAVSPGVWVLGSWWEVEQLPADGCSPSDSPGNGGRGGGMGALPASDSVSGLWYSSTQRILVIGNSSRNDLSAMAEVGEGARVPAGQVALLQ